MSGGLHSIGMQRDAASPTNSSDLSDGVDRTNFIISINHRNNSRVWFQAAFDFIRVDHAVIVNG